MCMDDSDGRAHETGPDALLARRSIVTAGGLLLGGLVVSALTGCNNNSARSGWKPNSAVGVTRLPGNYTVPANEPAYTPPRISGGVQVLPRSTWTRAGIARPSEAYAMNGVGRITVHHSGVDSSSLRSQSQVTRQIESFRQAHVRNGWADIGYHYIIDPQGRVYAGRPIDRQGAHVKDENEHNLGIMLMGNFDRQRPTGDALNTLQRLLAQEMRRYRVPLARVYTHQELRQTACPGRNLQPQMITMRARGGSLAQATGDSGGLA